MQLLDMKHILLYNQRSRPLVVRRENAAFRHEAYTSIQPGHSLVVRRENAAQSCTNKNNSLAVAMSPLTRLDGFPGKRIL